MRRRAPGSDRDGGGGGGDEANGPAPGRRTLTAALQRKARSSAPADSADAAPAAADTAFSGAGHEVPHRARMEEAFGRTFGDVLAHTDAAASGAADAIGADAFAMGNRIAFADRAPDEQLVAHELTHVVQQGAGTPHVAAKGVSSPGDAAEVEADRVADAVAAGGKAGAIREHGGAPTIARKPKADGGAKDNFPWIGRIWSTSSAALRSTPSKAADDPHKGTLADLPEGDFVNVIARSSGWLKVQATVDGKELEGWVSQELILFHSPTDWDDVRKMPSLGDAMASLKRAQTEKKQGVKLEQGRQEAIDKAVEVVKRNPKYQVDASTYEVTFAKSDAKIQVASIEDFILFVEDVERKYPGAKPAHVASEVRQLWFSDSNWDVLVDSDGISDGGGQVDIETEPNPVAKQYDMKDLAPSAGGKKIATRLGTVDIGHVMAGIDASLSGGPDAYPQARLKQRGADNGQSKFKYEKLKELNGGDPKSFTTWAGDLGQAYALFIADVVVHKKGGDLWQYVSQYAAPDEILGDIHGYIAVQVWKDTPAKDDPTGGAFKISSVLRDLYLLDKPGGDKDDGSYRAKFEKVSGKAGTELKNFIWSETFAFAEPWYVKYEIDNSLAAALDGYDELAREFNVEAGQHEDRGEKRNTLNGVVEGLLNQLDGTLDGRYTP